MALFCRRYIPQEIIDNIIQHLSDDKLSLKSCSLVSRSFTSPSQRRLFYDFSVHVRDYGNMLDFNVERLRRMLSDLWTLLEYVHVLRIQVELCGPNTPALIEVINRISNVEELFINTNVCPLAIPERSEIGSQAQALPELAPVRIESLAVIGIPPYFSLPSWIQSRNCRIDVSGLTSLELAIRQIHPVFALCRSVRKLSITPPEILRMMKIWKGCLRWLICRAYLGWKALLSRSSRILAHGIRIPKGGDALHLGLFLRRRVPLYDPEDEEEMAETR
ncbi:hypothetical protein AX16_002904 [Volvariella volvacea WC 439]|nr:hypothetical protein AX16_002904 [Volvariella volvacea WC 439]